MVGVLYGCVNALLDTVCVEPVRHFDPGLVRLFGNPCWQRSKFGSHAQNVGEHSVDAVLCCCSCCCCCRPFSLFHKTVMKTVCHIAYENDLCLYQIVCIWYWYVIARMYDRLERNDISIDEWFVFISKLSSLMNDDWSNRSFGQIGQICHFYHFIHSIKWMIRLICFDRSNLHSSHSDNNFFFSFLLQSR